MASAAADAYASSVSGDSTVARICPALTLSPLSTRTSFRYPLTFEYSVTEKYGRDSPVSVMLRSPVPRATCTSRTAGPESTAATRDFDSPSSDPWRETVSSAASRDRHQDQGAAAEVEAARRAWQCVGRLLERHAHRFGRAKVGALTGATLRARRSTHSMWSILLPSLW